MHTTSHEDASAGMDTMNVTTEVLRLHAAPDSGRQESLVTCSGRLARETPAVAVA